MLGIRRHRGGCREWPFPPGRPACAMPKLSVVVSQGQSANPAKRGLEEEIVTSLLFEKGIEVTVVPHLYDLQPDGTGLLALQGIPGDMIVLSWLYPRAAHWVLDRQGIKGHIGRTLLEAEPSEDGEHEDGDDEDAESGDGENGEAPPDNGIGARNVPNRRIFCLDLRTPGKAADYVAEIQRIASESTVQTFDLMSFIAGSPKPEQVQRYLQPGPRNVAGGGNEAGWTPPTKVAADLASDPHGARDGDVGRSPPPHALADLAGSAQPAGNGHAPLRIEEETDRRWYPVIDFSRCTNCLECLDFCLFG